MPLLKLTSPRRNKWLSRLDAEIYNMRAAMEWALTPDSEYAPGSVEAGKKAETGLRIAGALHWFWYLRGRITEGQGWLDKALAATPLIEGDDDSITARARALDTTGRLAQVQGRETGIIEALTESVKLWRQVNNRRGLAYALSSLGAMTAALDRNKSSRGPAILEEAVALFRQLDDKWGLAFALDLMGDAMTLMGMSDEESARYKQQSLSLYRDLDDRWGIASLLTELGYIKIKLGDYQAASKLLEEALDMARKVGDKRYMAFATAALAEVTFYMGNSIKAHNQYSESLALYRELGDRRGEANSLRSLGHLAHREGDDRQAGNLYYQSLKIERELGCERNMALLLGSLAGLVGATGNPRQAARLLGTSDAAFKSAGGLLLPIDRIQRRYIYETLRDNLGAASLEEEMTSGKAISLETGLQLINSDLPQ